MAVVKKRCIRCRKELREDGTCQNPNCVRYVPEDDAQKPQQGAAANES